MVEGFSIIEAKQAVLTKHYLNRHSPTSDPLRYELGLNLTISFPHQGHPTIWIGVALVPLGSPSQIPNNARYR
jgi:hypothetical protein